LKNKSEEESQQQVILDMLRLKTDTSQSKRENKKRKNLKRLKKIIIREKKILRKLS